MKNKSYFYFLLLFTVCFLGGCENHSNAFQGYIEGRYTYVAANFPGVLETLSVKRGETVTQHQALFTLEQEPELSSYNQTQAELEQAQSKVEEAQSAVNIAQLALTRRKQLLKEGHIDQESVDVAQDEYNRSKAKLEEALANVNAIKSALSQALWTVNKKTLYSPKNAYVFDTYFLPGELVPANRPVIALLSAKDIYLVFYIDEPNLSKIHLGQQIDFTCDRCNTINTATVSYISPKAEFTPPIIYSDERRAKLVYRIEADLPNPADFHPGQPIKVNAF